MNWNHIVMSICLQLNECTYEFNHLLVVKVASSWLLLMWKWLEEIDGKWNEGIPWLKVIMLVHKILLNCSDFNFM